MVRICTWDTCDLRQVCFSGSILLETFDIEVVSYDGHLPALYSHGVPEVCWV